MTEIAAPHIQKIANRINRIESITLADSHAVLFFTQRRIGGLIANKPIAIGIKYMVGPIGLQSVIHGNAVIVRTVSVIPTINSHHIAILVLMGSLALFILLLLRLTLMHHFKVVFSVTDDKDEGE